MFVEAKRNEGGSSSTYASTNLALLTEGDPPTADWWYSRLRSVELRNDCVQKSDPYRLTDGPLNRVCRYDILRPCLFPSGRQAALMPRQLTPWRLFADSQSDSFA